ncbi:MAG: glycoside hydrolase family 3 C-terminal domain-containing protein [Clostridiales Family XIII bacterium]|jgi:beta-glucosidase|nr:glycoside hydrolase family 3 C-terminal domain-containing protein [Clostridiales Family XIII bacterium]
MRKKHKISLKILSIGLSLLLVAGAFPVSGFAAVAAADDGTLAVQYLLNGGAGGAPADSKLYAAGADVVIMGMPAAVAAPDGKHFDGWNSSADGEGTAYAPGAAAAMPDGGLTLYAVWAALDSSIAAPSRVNYANGGTSEPVINNLNNQNFPMAAPAEGVVQYYTVDGTTPTRFSAAVPTTGQRNIPVPAGEPRTLRVVGYTAGTYSPEYSHTLIFKLGSPMNTGAPAVPAGTKYARTSTILLSPYVDGTHIYYTYTLDGSEPPVPDRGSAMAEGTAFEVPLDGDLVRVKGVRLSEPGSTFAEAGLVSGNVVELSFETDPALKSLFPILGGELSDAEKDALIDSVMEQLTLDEKVDLLGGTKTYAKPPSGVAGGTYTNMKMLSFGIPSMSLSDGPAGVNFGSGGNTQNKATAWSSPTSLASTWNKGLIYKVGEQTGKEAGYYAIDYMLSPAHDLIRNPLSGRNFEYYSEDPVVSGFTASEYTKGMQDKGVGAALKHFAANEQESFGNGGSPGSITGLGGNSGGGNVIASERALRELYLKSFEIPVREANPWSVMAAYNKINDAQVAADKWLLTDVLRGDWGFKGFVMSDWGAVYDGAKMLTAQMDLSEGSLSNGEKNKIRDAIRGVRTDYPELIGAAGEALLDRSVKNILRAIANSNVFKGDYGIWGARYNDTDYHKNFFGSELAKESSDVAYETAAESLILLKNTDSVLPLPDSAKIGLVTSPNLKYYAGWGRTITATSDFVIRGAGSSGVYVGDSVRDSAEYDPVDGILSFEKVLSDRGKLSGAVKDIYEAAGRTKTVTYTSSTANGEVHKGIVRYSAETRNYTALPESEAVDANLGAAAAAMADSDAAHGVMIISRQTGEGYDNIPAKVEDATNYNPNGNNADQNEAMVSKGYYLSTVEEKALKAYADALHAKGKKLIVLLNVGAAIDTTLIDAYADASLVVWYPGQNGAKVMADALYGKINPSGKTTQTFIKNFTDSPSVAASVALLEKGVDRLADGVNILPATGKGIYFKTGVKAGLDAMGINTNGGWGTNPVFYDEGVLMGYRWFDTKFGTEAEYRARVAYPFGFGLSYTDFEFSNIRLSKENFKDDDDSITATVTVKNVGGVAGKEVVQMYLGMRGHAAEGRPMKELKDYGKVSLDPGESTDVSFEITLDDLQYFDDGQDPDKVLTGSYGEYANWPGQSPGTEASNVEYGQGKGWTVNVGSVFDVIVGNTSDNFVLEEKGLKASFTYNGADPGTWVKLAPVRASMKVKGTMQLTVNTDGKKYEFVSSNNSVVRVDAATGVMTGIRPGTAIVTVRLTDGSGLQAAAMVNVSY